MLNQRRSYNDGVTDAELWQTVGEILLLHRTRREWNTVDVERAGGPTYKTVHQNEIGNIGRVDTLGSHARALGLSLADVLQAALSTAATLSPDAAALVRKFEATTVAGRQALLLMAQALPDAEAAPPAPRRLPPVPPARGPRNSGPTR